MLKQLQHLIGQAVPAAMLATLALASAGAHASVLVYTDRAAFQAAMGGTAADAFQDLAPGLLAGPVQRAAGYQAAALDLGGYGPGQGADALYVLEGADGARSLSTNFAASALQLTGFGANVRGLGGAFFGTDVDGALLQGPLTFTVQDQSGIFSFDLAGVAAGGFLGFGSDSALQSFTVAAAAGQPALYATVAALEVGSVPEPGSAWLFPLAGAAMLAARRRRS